jgi:hypothetical protein
MAKTPFSFAQHSLRPNEEIEWQGEVHPTTARLSRLRTPTRAHRSKLGGNGINGAPGMGQYSSCTFLFCILNYSDLITCVGTPQRDEGGCDSGIEVILMTAKSAIMDGLVDHVDGKSRLVSSHDWIEYYIGLCKWTGHAEKGVYNLQCILKIIRTSRSFLLSPIWQRRSRGH